MQSPPQQARNPVLLIHGLKDTIAKFNVMAPYLSALGWEVHRINLIPNYGSATLPVLAQQVADYIDCTFASEQPLDLLGFSMGGIVTRYYLQRLGGIQRVQRYISISAPNRGTVMAYGLPLPGIAQMRPDSELLQDLNRDVVQQLRQLKITVLWTPFDAMILPAMSSCFGIGNEIRLPVLLHPWMVSDRRVLAAIAQALEEPITGDRQSSSVLDPQRPPQRVDKI